MLRNDQLDQWDRSAFFHPSTHLGQFARGEMPNRITLYRRPILDYWAENEETLGDIVTHVLIHEIGHHFGLSDDDMERIEASAEIAAG